MQMNAYLAGKRVVISGGASGIGATIARNFMQSGAHVIVIDLNPPEWDGSESVTYWPLDLCNSNEVEQAIPSLIEQFESLDILVNTARGRRVDKRDVDTFTSLDEALAVALKATTILSQSFIHRQPETNTDRAIVSISSVSGQRVSAESSAYHIAKAGLDSVTRQLAVSGGVKGCRVNAVAPGFIVADMHRAFFDSEENTDYRQRSIAAHPLKRVGSDQDVANLVLFLSSPLASFITGQVITLDGGLCLRDGWAQLSENREA